MGQQEPVFLFCDETDIKMLLGAYVCGETVGEFVWRPGVVTEALQQGRWLVLEDVDRVPAEVLAALLPFSSSRRLVIPERNQCIDAHKDFHLFGTFSSGSQPVLWQSFESAGGTEGHVIGSHLAGIGGRVPPLVSAWTRVQLAPLLQTHLAELVDGLYPEFTPLNARLLESAAVLQQQAHQAGPALGSGPATGPRDILRWCARLRKAQLVLSPTFTEESRAVLLREALQVCCWAEWQTFGIAVRDTGTGKTSVVQHVGRLLGREVLVYNFNEQSESTELVGGFRPVDNVMQLMSELVESFCLTFEKSFSRRKNAKLLEKLRSDFLDRRWAAVLNDVGSIVSKAKQTLCDPVTQASKGVKGTQLAFEWERIDSLHQKASSVTAAGSAPKFEFKEGLLVQALRSGAWVVLDEINLAPSDLLQRIQGLIERAPGAHLALPESGNERVLPHADFRLFACMNPPRLPPPPEDTESAEQAQSAPPGARAGQAAGKKELPPGIRGRFTEIFVDEAGECIP
ncbi:unnamed protein product [Durusdinium trenchii]|uniref:ATPase dynein-related AAA domain-containing protein n=1 Tax=Durusdinium trenchii TaxID=1381693 RepID=A0ABP0N8N5_9DINO